MTDTPVQPTSEAVRVLRPLDGQPEITEGDFLNLLSGETDGFPPLGLVTGAPGIGKTPFLRKLEEGLKNKRLTLLYLDAEEVFKKDPRDKGGVKEKEIEQALYRWLDSEPQSGILNRLRIFNDPNVAPLSVFALAAASLAGEDDAPILLVDHLDKTDEAGRDACENVIITFLSETHDRGRVVACARTDVLVDPSLAWYAESYELMGLDVSPERMAVEPTGGRYDMAQINSNPLIAKHFADSIRGDPSEQSGTPGRRAAIAYLEDAGIEAPETLLPVLEKLAEGPKSLSELKEETKELRREDIDKLFECGLLQIAEPGGKFKLYEPLAALFPETR